MVEHVSILPENSTDLEKHIEFTLDNRVILKDRILRLSDIKYVNIPPDLVPWLLYQYGLLSVSQYLPTDPSIAIQSGLAVQRLKGTKEAMLLALSWIEFTPAQIDIGVGDEFGEYEFDTGRIPTRREITAIVNLAEFAQAARDQLVRLYHDYDIDPMQLNCTELNNGILSNFSGIFDEENGVWLSYLYDEDTLIDFSTDLLVESFNQVHSVAELTPYTAENQLNSEYDDYILVEVSLGSLNGLEYHRPYNQWTDTLSIDSIITDEDFTIGSTY